MTTPQFKRFLSPLLVSTLAFSVLLAQPGQARVTPMPNSLPFFFGQTEQGLQLDYTHFTLKNGLQVYLSRNTQTPRFFAQVVVNAGGKQDPADATGIAHYLEHMLFKGTDELGTRNFAAEKALQDQIVEHYETLFATQDPAQREALQKKINELNIQAAKYTIPGELDSLYSKLGASGLNAYTSNEETVYLVSLPKNRIEQWAKVESERFKDPVFRLFQSELETVYEEKNRALDNKDRILYEAVESLLYKKHPYGTQSILGSIQHLKNPSLKKMYEFYRRYYVPNNMALVISGDIDIQETRQIIERYFSDWEARPVEPFKAPQEAPIQGVERVKVQYQGEEQVTLAFRTVPYDHPDKDALTMVDMLLDAGDTGLIKLNLVQPQKVRAAGTYPSFNNDYGAQYLYAIPKEGQSLQAAEQLLLEQLNAIKQGRFDEEIMQAVALDFEISQKRALESNRGRGQIMAQAFLKGEKVEDALAKASRLRKLRKADIVKVANQYFGDNYVAGYREDGKYEFPKITKPQLKKVPLNPNQSSSFVQEVLTTPTEAVKPEWVNVKEALKVKSYAPGVLYYYAKNPLNDLFNLSISYDYGEKHHPHFCTVMSELNNAGTADMSPAQVANAQFKAGVKIGFGCSDYGFSMNISGTDEKFEEALKLGEKLLWSANLDPQRFEAKIANRLTDRADEKKDAKTLRSALRSWVRYGEDSAFIDRPSAQELKSVSVGAYPAMVRALKKQNFEIHYVGQLPQDKVEQLVRKHHQPQEIPIPLLNPRPAPPLEIKARHQDKLHMYFVHTPGAQANIDVIIPGDQVDPMEALIVSYYNEYMDGGMGAIMFQEVRESRALAYSTWSYFFQGARLGDQDQMLAYVGTQADKTLESVKLLLELMRNPPRSESHFARAKAALINEYHTSRIDFRKLFGTVAGWNELGFAEDPRPMFYKQIDAISLDDIFQYIEANVKTRPLTLTIVGDRDKVNLEELKTLGVFEEVRKDQLFRD